jgi:hypothetical protein
LRQWKAWHSNIAALSGYLRQIEQKISLLTPDRRVIEQNHADLVFYGRHKSQDGGEKKYRDSPVENFALLQTANPIPQGPKIFIGDRQGSKAPIKINGLPQTSFRFLDAGSDARVAGKVEGD